MSSTDMPRCTIACFRATSAWTFLAFRQASAIVAATAGTAIQRNSQNQKLPSTSDMVPILSGARRWRLNRLAPSFHRKGDVQSRVACFRGPLRTHPIATT